MFNVLADSNIPELERLSECCSVKSKSGRDICAEDLVGVDALLIRSVTKVDESLLRFSSDLKFVGTATIGTDHVDQALLGAKGISFSHAPGCNANAVVDYVFASLLTIYGSIESILNDRISIGIVGCGNVGSRLLAALRKLNVRCKVYDPLKPDVQEAARLQDVLNCDCVTLHVPLEREGPFPTEGMIDANLLAAANSDRKNRSAWIINTSRGEVIDSTVFTDPTLRDYQFILDVWRDEPAIDPELVKRCRIASTHVAGYSIAGKLRGSYVIFNAMADALGIEMPRSVSDSTLFLASCPPRDFQELEESELTKYFSRMVNIEKDMQKFRALAATSRSARAMALLFDCTRSGYILREETDYTKLLEQ